MRSWLSEVKRFLYFRFLHLREGLLIVTVAISICGYLFYRLVIKGALLPLDEGVLAIERVVLVGVLVGFGLAALIEGGLMLVDLLIPARGVFFRGVKRVVVGLVLIGGALSVGLILSAYEYVSFRILVYVIILTVLGFVYNRVHEYRQITKGSKS